MKYAENTAIGDAGEYFFAYTVATTLGWPCRLLDIDIGIDAQIEVLDDAKHSTGQFLAVQIKTTTDPAVNARYIELKHVQYWQTVETPVLIALVDLKGKKVYIKHIDKSASLVPVKHGGDTIKFDFDPDKDRLSKKLASKLRLLSFESDIKEIKQGLKKVRDKCELILKETDSEGEIIEDHDHYLELMRSFRSIETRLHESKIQVQRVIKYVGDCGYDDVKELFFAARSSLIGFFYDWKFHHHDAEEISNFENEYVKNTKYLEINSGEKGSVFDTRKK